MMRRLTDVAVKGCTCGLPRRLTGHRFFASSSSEVTTSGQKRLPDDDAHVSPTLKKYFNQTRLAMQMPMMTRKYAVSKAALIPIDSAQIDLQGRISDPILRSCGDIGLFGQRMDSSYNGIGLNALESTRVAEAMGLNASLFATLTAHEALGTKAIQLAGTEEQKRKYLPTLATGEKIAAFCLAEASSGSDPQPLQCRAVLSPDGKSYVLNGRKIWVTNGSRADVYTVFALRTVKNDKVLFIPLPYL
ncbi:unnamed protein product [Dibothriocephalus latus]|uniref:Acyl-CoA dehydrogenase/oxidase N-terminal domain-containing protein n=1 Tax=Dibothriocephalus latus TaxID=60516 RepID=A0A3P6TVW2_DIBLA|nr:unnamed protein product [Dibothriocephalus latus]